KKLQRSFVALAVSPDQVQGQIASQEQDSKYVPAMVQAIVATSVIDAVPAASPATSDPSSRRSTEDEGGRDVDDGLAGEHDGGAFDECFDLGVVPVAEEPAAGERSRRGGTTGG
ncbi:MAG: hypothetical protein LC792_18890, partial [Actinobacteria bacterium]|nr:hypothetical protein [Actinomycetota bacterium]